MRKRAEGPKSRAAQEERRCSPPPPASPPTHPRAQLYEPFFADFGPLNMGRSYRFCMMVREYLAEAERRGGKRLYMYAGPHAHQKANAACLVGIYMVMYLNRTADEAFAPLSVLKPFVPFRCAAARRSARARGSPSLMPPPSRRPSPTASGAGRPRASPQACSSLPASVPRSTLFPPLHTPPPLRPAQRRVLRALHLPPDGAGCHPGRGQGQGGRLPGLELPQPQL